MCELKLPLHLAKAPRLLFPPRDLALAFPGANELTSARVVGPTNAWPSTCEYQRCHTTSCLLLSSTFIVQCLPSFSGSSATPVRLAPLLGTFSALPCCGLLFYFRNLLLYHSSLQIFASVLPQKPSPFFFIPVAFCFCVFTPAAFFFTPAALCFTP